ncbi:MAG: hypothetical protein NTW19_18365 [Planctomycetota bacterium]|nr:hypothetical protein [Planctomycetota bacterium]
MDHAMQTILQRMPDLIHVGLFVGLFIGLAVWLLGRRMARLTCALFGALVGLAVGIAIAAAAGRNELAIIAIVATSFMGLALAWLLFRLWMSIGLAFVLAFAAPAALLVWEGGLDKVISPPQDKTAQAEATSAESTSEIAFGSSVDEQILAGGVNKPGEIIDIDDPRVLGLAGPAVLATGGNEALLNHPMLETSLGIALAVARPKHQDPSEHLAAGLPSVALPNIALPTRTDAGVFAQGEIESIRQSWGRLSPRFRQVAAGLAGAGAVTGLVVGLLWPAIAAALQSALVGSVIMVLTGGRLLVGVAPAYLASWGTSAKAMLLAVGLITALGVTLQCTIIRRQADR